MGTQTIMAGAQHQHITCRNIICTTEESQQYPGNHDMHMKCHLKRPGTWTGNGRACKRRPPKRHYSYAGRPNDRRWTGTSSQRKRTTTINRRTGSSGGTWNFRRWERPNPNQPSVAHHPLGNTVGIIRTGTIIDINLQNLHLQKISIHSNRNERIYWESSAPFAGNASIFVGTSPRLFRNT
ncbi:hypothetical protein ACHAXT_008603 [Thalassiosira profunda]